MSPRAPSWTGTKPTCTSGLSLPQTPSTLTFPVVLGAGGLEPWLSWVAAVMPTVSSGAGHEGSARAAGANHFTRRSPNFLEIQ